jgi:Adenylate and Guanylate cyclase catalytic domain
MITVPGLAAEALGSFLTMHMGRRFGATHANLIALISSAARLALECIGNSDALYHDVEHTMLVTLVGYEIMKGRSLLKPTSASDYAHLIVACLFHDIGFVRGIITGDSEDGYVIDANGGHVKLSRGSSDAALMPYHVERSKLFVMERIGNSQLLDARRISDAIEFTRFPITEAVHQDNEEGSLARAASLIGQLGDPHYLRKANALFYEFEELGVNKQLGYASPADLTDLYPKFYFNSISTHLQTAIRYLNVTSSGRQWIAGLHSNVFRAERELNLAGSGWQIASSFRFAELKFTDGWRRLGHEIGFGIGIAHGFATLGTIGFEGRFDYAAIGTVSNVASRLCEEAKPGQILISPRVLTKVENAVKVEPVGEFELKGIRRPLAAYNVVAAVS